MSFAVQACLMPCLLQAQVQASAAGKERSDLHTTVWLHAGRRVNKNVVAALLALQQFIIITAYRQLRPALRSLFLACFFSTKFF